MQVEGKFSDKINGNGTTTTTTKTARRYVFPRPPLNFELAMSGIGHR